MTINDCPHYTNRAEGTHYCTKCGRAWPQPCWEEQLSEAVSNGTPLQTEIMTELNEVLESPVETDKEPNPGLATPVPETPTKPTTSPRRGRRKVSKK